MSKRLGGIIGCKDKTSSFHLDGFPVVVTLGQQYNVREKLVLFLSLSRCLKKIQNAPRLVGPQPYPVVYVVANPIRSLFQQDRKRSEEHLQSSNKSIETVFLVSLHGD